MVKQIIIFVVLLGVVLFLGWNAWNKYQAAQPEPAPIETNVQLDESGYPIDTQESRAPGGQPANPQAPSGNAPPPTAGGNDVPDFAQ